MQMRLYWQNLFKDIANIATDFTVTGYSTGTQNRKKRVSKYVFCPKVHNLQEYFES